MTNRIAQAGLAFALALGSFAAVSPAMAGSNVEVYIGTPRPVYRPPVVVHRYYEEPVVVVRPRGCNPDQAMRKAWNSGIDRPYVSKINDNRVVVRGFYHGRDAKMVFANVRGCPAM